jgi:hypothetical protein
MIIHYHGGVVYGDSIQVVSSDDILASKVGVWRGLALGELVWTFYVGY